MTVASTAIAPMVIAYAKQAIRVNGALRTQAAAVLPRAAHLLQEVVPRQEAPHLEAPHLVALHLDPLQVALHLDPLRVAAATHLPSGQTSRVRPSAYMWVVLMRVPLLSITAVRHRAAPQAVLRRNTQGPPLFRTLPKMMTTTGTAL